MMQLQMLTCECDGLVEEVRTLNEKVLETAQLISIFVFATQIILSLFFLNPKFQDSSLFL